MRYMSDIFKDMQANVGCEYISDLPSYKRKVWHEMKRLNPADYEERQLEDFSKYVFGMSYQTFGYLMEHLYGRDGIAYEDYEYQLPKKKLNKETLIKYYDLIRPTRCVIEESQRYLRLEHEDKLDFINDMADSIGKSIQTLAGVTSNGFSSYGFYVGFLLLIILVVGLYVAYGWKEGYLFLPSSK